MKPYLDVHDEHAESLRALVETSELERARWDDPLTVLELEPEPAREQPVRRDPRNVRLLTALQAGQARAQRGAA